MLLGTVVVGIQNGREPGSHSLKGGVYKSWYATIMTEKDYKIMCCTENRG